MIIMFGAYGLVTAAALLSLITFLRGWQNPYQARRDALDAESQKSDEKEESA